MKQVLSVRVDEALLGKAKKLGIDLSSLVEATLATALKERKCPYCKQVLKKKK